LRGYGAGGRYGFRRHGDGREPQSLKGIALGSGKRLFKGEVNTKLLRLADAGTFRSGVVVLACQPGKEDLS